MTIRKSNGIIVAATVIFAMPGLAAFLRIQTVSPDCSAHTVARNKAAGVKSLSGDFTLVYDAVSSNTAASDGLKDQANAIRQCKTMLESGQMNQRTYDSFVGAMNETVAEQGESGTVRITISHSARSKSLFCQVNSPDVQTTSVFTAADQRTFSSSSNADRNRVFEGLRVDWIPGFLPIAGSVGEIDCVADVTQSRHPQILVAAILDPTRASGGSDYSSGYVRFSDGDISEIEPFDNGARGIIAHDWKLSNYVDIDGLHLPSTIRLAVNETQRENFGKAISCETFRLISATRSSLPPEAFSYDTHIAGQKGIRFDNDNSTDSFASRTGMPVVAHAEAEPLRRRASCIDTSSPSANN